MSVSTERHPARKPAVRAFLPCSLHGVSRQPAGEERQRCLPSQHPSCGHRPSTAGPHRCPAGAVPGADSREPGALPLVKAELTPIPPVPRLPPTCAVLLSGDAPPPWDRAGLRWARPAQAAAPGPPRARRRQHGAAAIGRSPAARRGGGGAALGGEAPARPWGGGRALRGSAAAGEGTGQGLGFLVPGTAREGSRPRGSLPSCPCERK